MAQVEARRRIRELPSIKELVKTTTALAIGRPIDSQNLQALVEVAFQLWENCIYQHKRKVEFISRRAAARAEEMALQSKISKPKKYPVTFDEFLKLTIGGRYRERREIIYRNYAKDMIWLSHINWLTHPRNPADKISYEEAVKIAKPASFDEVENWMKDCKERVYNDEESYTFAARVFLDWFGKQPSERAKKAADMRWGKERRQNEILKSVMDDLTRVIQKNLPTK